LEETNKRKETRVSGEGLRAVQPEMGAMTLYLTPPCKSLDLSCWNISVSLLMSLTKEMRVASSLGFLQMGMNSYGFS